MFWKLVGVLVLLASGLATGASASRPVRLASQFPVIGDGSAVINLQGQSAIGIVGQITPDVLAKTRDLVLADSSVKSLYVDSNGGDVLSAVNLAMLLRERNIRLVVAGRCFSACANYLFAGSRHKDILPGSLIAIHGKSVYLWDKDKGRARTMSSHDAAKATINPVQATELAAVRRAEEQFYKRIGFSGSHQLAFERYEQKHAQAHIESGACPSIQLWVLSKTNFREMGITGIDAAWVPDTEEEARIVAGSLGLQPERMFFGDFRDFGKLCGNTRPLPWLHRFFTF